VTADGSAGGRLDGKVALISGGARGLGATIARLFVGAGASVLVTDIRDEEGERLLVSLGGPGKAAYQHLDVRKADDWDAAVSRCEAEWGMVDVLVSNAMLQIEGAVGDVEPEDWQLGIDVNLTGPYLGVRAVLPGMRRAGRGSIVAISSSLGGEVAAPMFGTYQAAKAGTTALVKHVAVAYGAEGIRANAIHPGPMYTEHTEEAGIIDRVQGMVEERFPLRRIGRPEEVAWAAVYLASDESSYMTAASMAIDGGSSSSL
jgi:3alpha(or 20beta)-hydroxysteroid dehydrogenase